MLFTEDPSESTLRAEQMPPNTPGLTHLLTQWSPVMMKSFNEAIGKVFNFLYWL